MKPVLSMAPGGLETIRLAPQCGPMSRRFPLRYDSVTIDRWSPASGAAPPLPPPVGAGSAPMPASKPTGGPATPRRSRHVLRCSALTPSSMSAPRASSVTSVLGGVKTATLSAGGSAQAGCAPAARSLLPSRTWAPERQRPPRTFLPARGGAESLSADHESAANTNRTSLHQPRPLQSAGVEQHGPGPTTVVRRR
jgi:hypothetical protein